MKRVKFFAAIMIGTIVFSCTTASKKDTKEKIIKAPDPVITDTTMKNFYPGGRVSSEGAIKKVDGKPVRHGDWVFYYETGVKKMEGAFVDNKANGIFKNYNEKGELTVETTFVNEDMQGKKISYYPNGKVKTEEPYVKNKINGKLIKYFDTGTKMLEQYYVDGIKSGTSTSYYEDGTVKIFATYKDGSYNGTWYENYPTGAKKMEGRYVPVPESEKTGTPADKEKEGYKTGIWVMYYQNGNKAMTGKFDNDRKEGTWQVFHQDGWLESEGPYVKGGQTGIWNYYDNKKQIVARYTMKGAMINGPSWQYENGRLTGEGRLSGLVKNPKRNGEFKEYYPNGTVKSDGNYMMNKKSGLFKEYHPNGNLMAEGKYMNNVRNGDWKFYLQDGRSPDTVNSGYYGMGTLKKGLGKMDSMKKKDDDQDK